MIEQRWWFSVSWVNYPRPPRRVERFETMEQALLHAAATGGLVPFVHNLLDAGPYAAKRLYDYYFDLSEQTK
jgi:nitrate reductase assembly molybdenum cofactor insertion protein NarJ